MLDSKMFNSRQEEIEPKSNNNKEGSSDMTSGKSILHLNTFLQLRVVPKGEVGTLDKAVEYMRTFFSEDTDCELIFTNHAYGVLSYAKKNGLDVRKSNKCIAVFKKRTPSYWRDKILASGKMENEKFLLVEPQGIG
ncbi:hypothetical protein J6590_068285 [Homalodisca vitripennis]|nr:hypothetical protein J6590_068285 [Homalodisca vitripennis]